MSKKLLITAEVFKKSFYYIGPGIDFEPLYRFSNLTSIYLYANLGYEKQKILSEIEGKFKDDRFLELIDLRTYDDFNEEKYFELNSEFRKDLDNCFKMLDARDRDTYNLAFVPKSHEKQWMIEANFKRKGADRILKLYYFTGEGLASYIALSQNGKYPPRILCTIQTGILERRNGLMSQIFSYAGNSPFFWIRGFEGNEDYYTAYSSLSPSDASHNTSLEKDDTFNSVGMDFNFKWEVNDSYVKYPTVIASTRHCKGFLKENDSKGIIKLPYRDYLPNNLIYGKVQSVLKVTDDSPTLIIATLKVFKEDGHELPKNVTFLSWEELLNNNAGSKMSLKDSLQKILKVDKQAKYKHIYFIPYGLEDEGFLLDRFLKRKHNAIMHAVLRRPLDFIDLKIGEYQSNA